MADISFTSRIIPTTRDYFSKFTQAMPYDCYVDYPYRISSSRIQKNVLTTHVCDCTACLVTDGEKAMLMHLIPSHEPNHDIGKVSNFIKTNFNINNKENMQALILGSHQYKSSQHIFNNFINFFNKLKIPTTILRIGKSPTDIAYKTSTDEIIITNKDIANALKEGKNKTDALKSGFKEVKISEFDEI